MKYELQLYQFFPFSSVSRISMAVMYSGCCDGGDIIVNATSQPSLCEPLATQYSRDYQAHGNDTVMHSSYRF